MRVALPYPRGASRVTALGADYSSRRLIESLRKYASDVEVQIVTGGEDARATIRAAVASDPRDGAAHLANQAVASSCSWDILHDVRPAGDPRRHFYLRSALNRDFPIVQTHHAFNYPFYLNDYFLPLLLAGTQPFDAVICQSRASRQAFSNLLEICAEGLARLSGGWRPEFRARLPVIANGVDTERFRPRERRAVRRELNVPDDVFVILWLGRLSRATKADLVPLLCAYAKLRERSQGRAMLLVLVGTDGEGYSKALEASARALGLASSIRIERVSPVDPVYLWYSAADVFVSPVDNVQETFGNTVIEAMAAGVPQVVSDWNGYRDTVVHAETGFRVRTVWAPCDDNAIGRWAAWGDSVGAQELLAQTVACDLGELVRYLEQLLYSRELREAMGTAARKRAVAQFAWPVIVSRYVECWRELRERSRGGGRAGIQPRSIMPAFFRAFGGYASQTLTDGTRLRMHPNLERASSDVQAVASELATTGVEGARTGDRFLIDGLPLVLSVIGDAEGNVTLAKLIDAMANRSWSPGDVMRLVLRGIKYGLVEAIPADLGTTSEPST